jgi:hypothetical protein
MVHSILAWLQISLRTFRWRLALLTSAATLLLASTQAEAVLRHQYTFEGPNVAPGGKFLDTVGRAHGTLHGNATIADGKLILPGGGAGIKGDHARLLPNGIDGININKYTNVTLAIWATTTAPQLPLWTRYYDFGGISLALPDSAGNHIFLSPRAPAPRQIQFTITNVDIKTEHGLDNFQRVPELAGPTTGKLHHIVVTFDGKNDVGRLYVDGIQVAENVKLTHQLELLQTDYALLGGSLYERDGSLPGSISQFEIYDTALSPEEVNVLFLDGPIDEAE